MTRSTVPVQLSLRRLNRWALGRFARVHDADTRSAGPEPREFSLHREGLSRLAHDDDDDARRVGLEPGARRV